ncbi:MAG TPA: acyltransferase family protein, partial [Kofleriaceae bacterium]|nr:acyltransferase family protein [Kofleriaceae bacterium]
MRQTGLDAARAYAMLLVIALHAAVPFMATPIGWAIEDPSHHLAVDVFVWLAHAFVMPVFFWLSGLFGRATYDRVGLAGFARSRLVRIAVPLAIALVPCSLAMNALWDWAAARRGVVQVATLHASGLPITLAHLWFLYYLLAVSVIAVAIARVPRVIALVGAAVVAVAMMVASGSSQIDTPLSFAIDPIALVFHAGFFVAGWHARQVLGLYVRLAWPAVAVSVGLAGASFAALAGAIGQPPSVIVRIGIGALSVSSTIGFIGLCLRFGDRPRRWVRFVARASYWSYIVHLPIVVLLQIALVDVPLVWPLKLAAIAAVATLIC